MRGAPGGVQVFMRKGAWQELRKSQRIGGVEWDGYVYSVFFALATQHVFILMQRADYD